MTLLELAPQGHFLTYGIGVSLRRYAGPGKGSGTGPGGLRQRIGAQPPNISFMRSAIMSSVTSSTCCARDQASPNGSTTVADRSP